MTLKTTQPNVGNENVLYADCPNCSRMFQVMDDQGKKVGLPPECPRCTCPIDEKANKAVAWMNEQAERHHEPALAELGRRSRGVNQPPADKMVASPAVKK